MPIKEMAGDMLEGRLLRKIVREQWSLLGDDNSIGIDFTSEDSGKRITAFLSEHTFDRWLATQTDGKGVL